MSIKIAEYIFDGPFYNRSSLENKSGVYAILCGDTNKLIDVGESAEVRNRVENHDRKDCWGKNCNNTIKYAVRYTPNLQQSGRKEIEQDIRSKLDIPCGEQ